MYTHNVSCRICQGKNLEAFLDLGKQPLANAFLKKEEFSQEKKYPLNVYFCHSCHLLQLLDVVSPEVLFRNYIYVSSTSPVFIAHFESFAKYISERFGIQGALVVDIGSNDGILLRHFKNLGAKILGIDPAENIAAKATQEGIETLPYFFSPDIARDIAREKHQAKIITANNVFAHVDDVKSLIKGVKILLENEGVFIIEVPYLVDFLEKKLFDTVYHEHLSYFAVNPLQTLFLNCGMKIFDIQKVNSHGGSIRVFVKKDGSGHKVEKSVREFLDHETELKLDSIDTYLDFSKDVSQNKSLLVDLLKNLKSESKKIAGYGAPAKGNTLLNYTGIDFNALDYIIDDSPYKQGLYTPGTHIPVVGPEMLQKDRPDFLFILAWNFADSIIEKCADFKAEGGKFIIPVPKPSII